MPTPVQVTGLQEPLPSTTPTPVSPGVAPVQEGAMVPVGASPLPSLFVPSPATPPTQPTIPTWVWVAGGVLLLGLIGAVLWAASNSSSASSASKENPLKGREALPAAAPPRKWRRRKHRRARARKRAA